jgi:hypothetical protein
MSVGTSLRIAPSSSLSLDISDFSRAILSAFSSAKRVPVRKKNAKSKTKKDILFIRGDLS